MQKITNIKVCGKLPDPFLKPDGTRVKNESEWQQQRKHLCKSAVELQYGTMPPQPEFLELQKLHKNTYRIVTGRHEKPVSFIIRILRPETEEKLPVVIYGDGCFNYAFEDGFVSSFLNENIMMVVFNRVELAPDVKNDGKRDGPLYECYPEYTFGALGAWAWGYSRVIDALELLDIADLSCIAVTGHSRGGKTTALAGALDERISIVQSNDSGAGGCGCFRVEMNAINDLGIEKRNETLEDILKAFPYWFGPDLKNYVGRESELPFDAHFLKSLIAPRTLFVSEALDDIWANPVGTSLTNEATQEVYDFLDASDNFYWYWREGRHRHELQDIKLLINIIKHKYEGTQLCDDFFKLPFEKPSSIYDWTAPCKE